MTHAETQFESPPRAQRDAIGAEPVANSVSASPSDHADILDQLSDYLDGALSPVEAERVQQHLDRCERCQAFARTLGNVVSATRRVPAEPLAEQTRRRLIDNTLSVPT